MELNTRRRSGRTTRMLGEAAERAANGAQVTVVLPIASMVSEAQRLYMKHHGPVPSNVRFVRLEPNARYWAALRGTAGHVLYDHLWYEMRHKIWRSPEDCS